MIKQPSAMPPRDVDSRPVSPTPSQLPPIPSSPTYSYASTSRPIPSSFNLPLPPPPRSHAVLSKSNLEASSAAYSELLSTAKNYRLALAQLSLSASTFGSALEACARLKEACSDAMAPTGDSMTNSFSSKGNCTADSLLAASGVHQLIANHQQILSETVYRSFEVPLLHELDQWQRRMEEEEESYQREAKVMSKEIRRMEKEGLKLHKQRKRDIGMFREHLVSLTQKLDMLTGLSGGHSRGLLRDCQEMSKGIVDCSAGLVRAEVDIFESLAKKGWNGGGLDELLEKGRDLFANEYGGEGEAHPNQGAKIFSILPQNRSILAHGHEDGRGGPPPANGADSLLVDAGGPYQSLASAMIRDRDTDIISIFSERDMPTSGLLNRSRGVRPFSPTPGERVRDPLEDHPAEELHVPTKKEENAYGVADHLGSVRTVVQLPMHIPAPHEPAIPHSGNDEAIEDDSAGAEESEEARAWSEDERERRKPDRRWSVTDEGVVSD